MSLRRTLLDRLDRVLARARTQVPGDVFIHPSAIVDPGAHLGPGTKVWHFCHVQAGARLGARCSLGQNAFVAAGVTLGDGVKVQNNVSLYAGVVIEDLVFLGPSCVFTNVGNPRAEINRRGQYERTLVRRGATIGANATIVCGVTIGRFAFIGAGAVVTRDVPDYGLMLGTPARRVGWMSRHGQRLPAADADGVMTCGLSGLRYREIEAGVLRCQDVPEDAPLPSEPHGAP